MLSGSAGAFGSTMLRARSGPASGSMLDQMDRGSSSSSMRFADESGLYSARKHKAGGRRQWVQFGFVAVVVLVVLWVIKTRWLSQPPPVEERKLKVEDATIAPIVYPKRPPEVFPESFDKVEIHDLVDSPGRYDEKIAMAVQDAAHLQPGYEERLKERQKTRLAHVAPDRHGKLQMNVAIAVPLIPPRRSHAPLTEEEIRIRGDQAAILVHSVRKAWSTSKYVSPFFVAIATKKTSQMERELMSVAGFEIVEKVIPVKIWQVNEAFQERVNSDPCCGETELIRLWAYDLVGYDVVIQMDLATMLVQNLDSILDTFRSDTHMSLMYTADTDSHHVVDHQHALVQSDFLALRPNPAIMAKMFDLFKNGNYDVLAGWEKSYVGRGYGGANVQGLLTYMYKVLQPWASSKILDPCEWNHLGDLTHCAGLQLVRSTNFQACGKPWKCEEPGTVTCEHMSLEWWRAWEEVQMRWGADPVKQEFERPGKCAGGYKNLHSPYVKPIRPELQKTGVKFAAAPLASRKV